MSIKKAKIFLKAKLRRDGKKLVAKTRFKKIMLNNENQALLSFIGNNIDLQDLARLSKKKINYVLKNIIDLEESGVVELRLFCDDPVLKALYEAKGSIDKICKERPGISNIIAYEREWGIYPSVLDFLDKESENYKLKDFQKGIYLDIVRPFIDEIPKGSNIIDAGGGIGRFAVELIKMGYKIQVVDSSETALKKALKHFQDENLINFDLHLGDAANLSMFRNGAFDAAFAIELICYSDKPDKIVKELVRVTRKNGLIVISVEGKYGGMLSDANVSFDKLPGIFKRDLLYIKNYLYVRYYTPVALKRLLEGCGVEVIDIIGSHYVTDGVFHKLINIDKLDNKDYNADLLKIEKSCRKDPILQNLARAWVAIGRRK